MKKKYMTPELECVEFKLTDVILGSTEVIGEEGGGEFPGEDDGPVIDLGGL